MQTFTIDGKPFGKQRPRVTTKGAFAHAYTPKETAEYEELVRTAYKTQCVGKFPKDIPLSLTIVAVFEPPKSDSKKKREDKLNCVVISNTPYGKRPLIFWYVLTAIFKFSS